jgi:23S rRNA (adenine2503-C2)-methyltransferase
MKRPLASLLPEELVSDLRLKHPYRGDQIFQWVQSGVADFHGMTNLPKELRQHLEQASLLCSSRIGDRVVDADESRKYRIELRDGKSIETVLLVDSERRKTVCVSTQVGCAMGCRFCRTASMGLLRNLESHEIVEQVMLVERDVGKADNIVFMGMGEPLHNLKNLRKAVAVLTHPLGRGFAARRMTLSTCGIAGGIEEMATQGPPIRLAVSLVTADSNLRSQLMPSAKANSLAKIREALLKYQRVAKKRITLELVLIAGLNTRQQDVQELIRFVRGLKVVVNLIPWNPFEDSTFQRPDRDEIDNFKRRLNEEGVAVTQRFRRGSGISAACGQLSTAI